VKKPQVFEPSGEFTISVNGVCTESGQLKVQVLAPIEADGLLLTRNEARQLAELLTACADNLDRWQEIAEG